MVEMVLVFLLLLGASLAGVLESSADSRRFSSDRDARGWWPARRGA